MKGNGRHAREGGGQGGMKALRTNSLFAMSNKSAVPMKKSEMEAKEVNL